MTCTKTGCHAYLVEYGEHVYGDAYEINGVAVLRISERSFTGPLADRLHYTVAQIGQWFDKDARDGKVSTLVATRFTYHGYNGKDL